MKQEQARRPKLPGRWQQHGQRISSKLTAGIHYHIQEIPLQMLTTNGEAPINRTNRRSQAVVERRVNCKQHYDRSTDNHAIRRTDRTDDKQLKNLVFTKIGGGIPQQQPEKNTIKQQNARNSVSNPNSAADLGRNQVSGISQMYSNVGTHRGS